MGVQAVTAKRSIQVTNPVTGALIGTITQTSPDDIQQIADQARAATVQWQAKSVKERCKLIRRWGDLLWDDQERAMRIIRDETGKNDTGAYTEIVGIDNYISYYTRHAPRLLAPQRRTPIIPILQRAKVHYKPRGVVGFITPWNYPMMLAMMDMVPALIAGNTVIIKPSEIAPYSVLYVIDLLHKVGIPPHVAQVVTGDGQAGAELINHVDYICFTGSSHTGRLVAKQAADQLIEYSLELGAKDVMIVLRDADLDLAASAAIVGSCENAGQACVGTERVYVEDAIHDEFVARVKQFAQQMTIGSDDGFDVHMGSMTNERELQRTEAHIQDALDKGAKLVYGGNRLPDLGPLFFEPTVLTHVDHTMDIMQEETFGPVIPIMKVESAEEAVHLANESEYGLSAMLFTSDLDRGEQIVCQLNTGDVNINRFGAVIASPRLPWGGQKSSGISRRGGKEGLLRFTTPQSILIDTQIGVNPTLTVFDATVLKLVRFARVLRRWFPFI